MLIARAGSRAPLQLLALRLRSRMAFLRDATALHILVVTLRCEHSCPYCQVSRRSTDAERYDMDEATALRALDVAMSSPGRAIKVEFQGGEPLLNFPLIRYAVETAERMAEAQGKHVEFVIATNLALLDDAILGFCLDHNIQLSTSLDGPADLHNRNRPASTSNNGENTATATSDPVAAAKVRHWPARVSPLRSDASLHPACVAERTQCSPSGSVEQPWELVLLGARVG